MDAVNELSGIGENVREARQQRGWSLRKLAAEADVSASLISQIENGRANPSVRTLYSLAEALDLPVAEFIPADTSADPAPSLNATTSEVRSSADAVFESVLPLITGEGGLLRSGNRPKIELEGGVTWQRLTQSTIPSIEFLEVTYAAGATSGKRMSHHTGAEFGLILEGELTVEIGFEQHHLATGDSITFDSSRPHRLTNQGNRPMRAIWVIWNRTPDQSPELHHNV